MCQSLQTVVVLLGRLILLRWSTHTRACKAFVRPVTPGNTKEALDIKKALF